MEKIEMNDTTTTIECKPKRRRIKVTPEYLLKKKELSAQEAMRLCIYQRLQAESRYVSAEKLPDVAEFLSQVKAGKYIFNTEDLPFVVRGYHLCTWLEEQYILCEKHFENVMNILKTKQLTIELATAEVSGRKSSAFVNDAESEKADRQTANKLYQSISYIASFNCVVELIEKELRIDELKSYIIPFEEPFTVAMKLVNESIEKWKKAVVAFGVQPLKNNRNYQCFMFDMMSIKPSDEMLLLKKFSAYDTEMINRPVQLMKSSSKKKIKNYIHEMDVFDERVIYSKSAILLTPLLNDCFSK